MNINITVPDGYLATAVVNDKPYTVSPDKMTSAALLHVFEYGFQRIVNDKTGGKDKTDADKDAAAVAMLTRLTAAEYVRRKIGTGATDPIVRFTREIMRDIMRDKRFVGKAAEYKAISADQPDLREAFLDDWFGTMPGEFAAKVTAAAQAKLDESIARKKRDVKLIDSLLPDMPGLDTPTTELVVAADRETPAAKAAKKKKQ